MQKENDVEMILGREYQDGDLVEFDFEPNALDLYDFHVVKLVGIIESVLIEEDGRVYAVQIRDDGRKIIGTVTIPECHINRKIE